MLQKNSLTGSNDFKWGHITDSGKLALASNVRWLLIYIKRGDVENAKKRAIAAAHIGNALLKFCKVDENGWLIDQSGKKFSA